VLYNAKSLIEFRDKLKCYEVVPGKSKSENKNQVMYSKANHTEAKSDYKKQAVPNRNASRDLKSYNCGARGHTSAKCFQCNNFGHIAKECPEKCLCEKVEATNMCKVSSAHAFMGITVESNNFTFIALIDTGGKYNLVTDTTFKNLNKPRLSECNILKQLSTHLITPRFYFLPLGIGLVIHYLH